MVKGHDASCPQETKDDKKGRAQFIVPLHIRNYRELTRRFLSGKMLIINQEVENTAYGRIIRRFKEGL